MTSHTPYRLIGDEYYFAQPSPEGWPDLITKLRYKSEHPYGSMTTHKLFWVVHE